MRYFKKNALLIRYFLMTFLLFFMTAVIVSHQSFKTEITEQLQHQIAPELTRAFKQHMFDSKYKFLVMEDINRQFSLLENSSSWGLISDYSFNVQALFLNNYSDGFFYNAFIHKQLKLSSVYIHWHFGLEPKTAKIAVNFSINWWLLIVMASCMAVITSFIMFSLPKPESAHAKYWLDTLKALKLEHEVAKKLSKTISQEIEASNANLHEWLRMLFTTFLDDPQLVSGLDVEALVRWFINENVLAKSAVEVSVDGKPTGAFNVVSQEKFIAALILPEISFEQAYQLARQPSTLLFNIDNFTVNANGIDIKLAKTPFFYYLWYAYLRVNDVQSGWLINPSSAHPDLQSAKSILALMKEHNGHSKSINELETHGLRAKTLDQNRNKIKESFVAQLGESLSEAYLFELLRDTRTGRFQYRLKLDSARIFLPKSINYNN